MLYVWGLVVWHGTMGPSVHRHIAHTQAPTSDPHTQIKRYREWRLATPFITRATLQLLVALWALSWVVDSGPWVVNVPALTILRLQRTWGRAYCVRRRDEAEEGGLT